MLAAPLELEERFTGDTLDPDVWFPYYLPHWSSRARSAATCSVRDGELHLSVPVGVVTARSMFAFWMSGIEDRPERSGEICVAEVFGEGVRGSSADVGIGVHRFRDPALVEEFAAGPLAIDVTEFHTYGVDWRPGSLAFTVDGEVVRQLDQAPGYPMQLMIGVFDFPARAAADDVEVPVPQLVVSHVRGQLLT